MFIDENGKARGMALTICNECQSGDCGNCNSLREWVIEHIGFEGWRDPKIELPPNDKDVLVLVSGKPAEKITLVKACEIASYDSDEGWILEMWPEWENAEVHYWIPMPEPPEK